MDTAAWFRRFAETEARGSSPTYERLALAVAGSAELIGRLDELPPPKRQPNLLFAASQLLNVPFDTDRGFVREVVERWDTFADVMSERSTQTNEPARTGAFLPLLARIEGPITLIEVGASAGLCLYPDRYRIRYGDHEPLVTDSAVHIDVAISGPVPIPVCLPEIIDRVGIDLIPLDPGDESDLGWLGACIWPEHEQRRQRLFAAARIVRADPPRMIRANLVDAIGSVVDEAAPESTPVVIHSAVLNYLSAVHRREFSDLLDARPQAVWVSNEAAGVVDGVTIDLEPPAAATGGASFIVAESSIAVAIADPHGSWLRWRP